MVAIGQLHKCATWVRQTRRGTIIAAVDLFTWFHTILSLIAIAGLVVVRDLFASRGALERTALFIATALTSATGFGFKAPFGPSHVVGVISLVLLAGSTLALYVFRLAGR
ncbi:MAG TPA: hypothetical protein VH519_10225 [Hyphomicrobiaceae bacterium]|jgi:hypothetical protein